MQAIPCANTQYLNAYLRDEDEAYRRESWIEREAEATYARMLPLSASDLDEAIGETMADKEKRGAIVAAFGGADDAALGAAVRAAAKAYWLGYCTQQAAEDYDNGAADDHYEG